MANLTQADVESVLGPDETAIACMPVDGVHAAKHDFYPTRPHVLLTNRRLGLLSQRGAFKKRVEEDASWPLSAFTSRLNLNEGTALGPFMYFATLFTHDGETVSVAFKSPKDRDTYKQHLASGLQSAVD